MTFHEYMAAVLASSPADWLRVDRPTCLQDLGTTQFGVDPRQQIIEIQEHHTVLTLRNDLSVGIALGLPHLRHFKEPWAQNFPDPDASSSWLDFLWNGRPVHRELRVF